MLTFASIVAGAASGKGATPAIPTLTYTAENQFTISDYDSTFTYTVTNGTRSGAVVTVTSASATISARTSKSVVASGTRSLLTLANGRVLTTVASTMGSEGCGPRPNLCCSSGILNTNGDTCGGSPGTVVPDNFCGNTCDPGNCFGLYMTCYNWYWTDYTSSGYTLQGSVWGKAQ